ncbi:hypothetical protein Fcan01_21010 [Folsomia candida]|uniref:Uncharacterized protein n=1 Tax=Folsomia candida TaxID=158441 RepID=A0A226DI48_FOLCA|nr:hypothetical protein Fcan01_21010 [Folsomia candida]
MDNSVKIEDLVATANPATNVIIANGGMFDEMNDAVNYFLEPEYWDYEEAEGPLCHLCGEGILDKSNILIYNGVEPLTRRKYQPIAIQQASSSSRSHPPRQDQSQPMVSQPDEGTDYV